MPKDRNKREISVGVKEFHEREDRRIRERKECIREPHCICSAYRLAAIYSRGRLLELQRSVPTFTLERRFAFESEDNVVL
jgi:hypothetical protein